MEHQSILPDSKVLFIGGHKNFISKIKKKYPDWVYLKPEERNCKKVKGDFFFVVAKTDSISHNIVERAYAFLEKDVPTIYAKGTNVDRVVSGIEEEYSKILQRNAC